VHYEAKMHGIKGEKSEHSAMEILKAQWIYILPLVVITIFMLTGFSPAYSAILGIATCITVGWKTKDTRMDITFPVVMTLMVAGGVIIMILKKTVAADNATSAVVKLMETIFSGNHVIIYGLVICAVIAFFRKDRPAGTITELKRFVGASRKGTESSLKIGATVGVIGIIIGVLTYSGLVLTFADIVIQLADGRLWLTILLIALASLVLGMGVPVTAAYLITAVVAVPALTHLGVNEIAAHMIVYWLSQDSNITPPVCIAAFAGATIAKANMWRTAFASFKFAKFLYLGPFLFGYVPAFTLDGSTFDIIKAFVLIFFGTYLYSWFLSGIWIRYIRDLISKKRAVAD
jgi:TRAP-type uncharacterized transport system fused permease subunit